MPAVGDGGWTNDLIITFVVPSNATTGARIVLDGLTGLFQVYDSLNRVVVQMGNASPVLLVRGAAASNVIIDNTLLSEAFSRWLILGDGTQEWGPGSGVQDVQLSYGGPGQLDLTGAGNGGTLICSGGLQATNNADFSNTENTGGTTTSVTYTAALTGAPGVCGTSFNAPPSGAVTIEWVTQTANSTGATGWCGTSFEVRQGSVVGSGTLVQASSDTEATFLPGNVPIRAGAHSEVTGLTPGAQYNVQLMYRVSGGTGTYTRRKVTVKPSL